MMILIYICLVLVHDFRKCVFLVLFLHLSGQLEFQALLVQIYEKGERLTPSKTLRANCAKIRKRYLSTADSYCLS